MRLRAKDHKAAYLTSINRTGNIAPEVDYSDMDERISEIFGESGSGLAVIPEGGIMSDNVINAEMIFYR